MLNETSFPQVRPLFERLVSTKEHKHWAQFGAALGTLLSERLDLSTELQLIPIPLADVAEVNSWTYHPLSATAKSFSHQG
jgi:hypothetical protein